VQLRKQEIFSLNMNNNTTMSAEPGAPAEELPSPDEADQPATKRFVSSMIHLSELRLKDQLETERTETTKAIERAISALKSDLRTEQRDRESDESSKRLDRSLEWSKRFTCAVAGGAICFVLFISLQECSSLHSRVTTLELKK
jgi:hypothetical protein